MAEKYTNIRIILDRLLTHPLLQDLSLERVVDMTVQFMNIVGVPDIFVQKIKSLQIKEYRALLPCDYISMTQVRSDKYNVMYRYTTDSFHLDESDSHKGSLTYKIQGDIIYSSVEEDDITISYNSIITDEDGFPMIPDNSSFTRALELFIKKQYFTILFDLNKINPQVLQNIQQEYAWAVGDCQNEFNRLSIDKAESFYNSWSRLILANRQHLYGFKNIGDK